VLVWWLCLVGILKASCSWMSLSFLRLGEFSTVMLLDKLSVLLVCLFSSSIPKIYRFGLLMVYQSLIISIRIFLVFFHCLWLIDLIPVLYIPSLILYFQLVSLSLARLSIDVFIWDIEFFISKILIWFF
jgi:hypothetical protein